MGLYSVKKISFSNLKGRICKKVFRTSADRVFWVKDSPRLPSQFVGFVLDLF